MTLLNVAALKAKDSLNQSVMSKSLDLHVKFSIEDGNNVAKAKDYGGQLLEEPHVA
jgi:hypothetical protein